MASISKFHASLLKPTQETTFALANANFDFSLIKVQPHEEYLPIGNALSRLRRDAGEMGSQHTTARRLGSIFKSIIPKTPNLIKAYGQRASAISESPDVNPKGTRDHGPFQEYIGLDGSTVWAAATSGDEAIAVHLLACMLASHFSHAEAMAIWTELISERQRQLAESMNDDVVSIDDAVASRLEVSVDQLQEWESSARAWLKAAADAEIVKEKQKKLMAALHSSRLVLPVRGARDVYQNVTHAWKLALETMDGVVSGAAYSVEDGAVLIAMTAWHLYPDIIFFGSLVRQSPNEGVSQMELRQGDALVRESGQVTIGLSLPPSRATESKGVTWSLALSNLRYYTQPFDIRRHLGSESRLSFDQFMIVVLGAIVHHCDPTSSRRDNIDVTMAVVDTLEKIIREHCSAGVQKMVIARSWITPIKSASLDTSMLKKMTG